MCSGDFRQLLPVVKRGNDSDIYNVYKVQQEGNEYSQFLIKIGEDKIEKNENGEIALPSDMIIPAIGVNECIEYIYPFFDQSGTMFADNCMLVPLNENHKCIEKFPGEMKKIFFLQLCLCWNRSHTLSYGFLD